MTLKEKEKEWEVRRVVKGKEGKKYEGNTYKVRKSRERWSCECPYYTYQGGALCKHIKAVMAAIRQVPEMSRGGEFLKEHQYEPFTPRIFLTSILLSPMERE